MDNRRQPTPNAPKPFNRSKPYRKDDRKDGEKPFGAGNFQSRENRFQPRNDGFQSRDEKFQPRDSSGSKFQSKDEKFQPKNERFQPKERFAQKGKRPAPVERENRPRIVSDMQVTDGKYLGKFLQSTASPNVRPTARRLREVMFRILFRRVRAGRFLDLCAGSGTVGIEAVSRGAMVCTFVERSAKMCGFIKKNMETCGIKPGHGEIVEMEVAPFLKRMAKRRRVWDVVYFDPPYGSNYEEILDFFSRGTAINPRGVLIIEHHAEMFFPEIFGAMKRWRVIVQGDSALSFYEKT